MADLHISEGEGYPKAKFPFYELQGILVKIILKEASDIQPHKLS